MKRGVFVILILCLVASALSAAGIELHRVDAYPTQLVLSWSAVDGADYYDIYLDRAPITRITRGETAVLGSPENPLLHHHTYQVIIAARKEGNVELGWISRSVKTASLYSKDLAIRTVLSYPNQLLVGWTLIEGADYYDLYLDTVPMARVRGNAITVLGSNEEPLLDHRAYELLIAARKEGDVELGYVTQTVYTTGWEGQYQWVNTTKKDNKGRAKQFDYRVTWDGQSYLIEGLFDRWYTLYPLVSEDQIGVRIPFDGESESQRAYRNNIQAFNTTKIRPDSWMVVNSSYEQACFTVEVLSTLGAVKVMTRSLYQFVLNENSQPELHFQTAGDGVAVLSVFRSPNPGDGGIFKATRL
jgi:hypothetical protein